MRWTIASLALFAVTCYSTASVDCGARCGTIGSAHRVHVRKAVAISAKFGAIRTIDVREQVEQALASEGYEVVASEQAAEIVLEYHERDHLVTAHGGATDVGRWRFDALFTAQGEEFLGAFQGESSWRGGAIPLFRKEMRRIRHAHERSSGWPSSGS
jgi:hypothetical protein